MRIRRRPPPRTSPLGTPAAAIQGRDLSGADVELSPGDGRTVLYFLTSSCRDCREVWAALGAGVPGVAVTPDAATEDRRKLRSLAAGGVRVVMSTAAWIDYAAGPAPWMAVVDDGVVSAEGPAARLLR